jgi:hypothetical protein
MKLLSEALMCRRIENAEALDISENMASEVLRALKGILQDIKKQLTEAFFKDTEMYFSIAYCDFMIKLHSATAAKLEYLSDFKFDLG